MSELKIKDGTGTGKLTAVDDENRLRTFSVIQSHESHAVEEGKTWNISTGKITLTTATASAIQYVKNTGTSTLVVPLYIIITDLSTGGPGGGALVEILRNPDAGTVVSDASDGTNVNANFSSSAVPSITHYKGAQGKTLSGEDAIMNSRTTDATRLLLGIVTYLPTGASVGIRVTPPTGNTSMVIESVMEIFAGDS